MKLLITLFIIVPALEIFLFLLSGQTIGVWPTVALIFATGIIGTWLAKRQGVTVIEEAKNELMRGRLPSEAVLDGICIFIGGVLLLTPGFLTDIVGFILLLPVTRKFIKPFLVRWLKSSFTTKTFFYIKR
ncbi:FxsA family protein [Thermaerobacillus caldiproteolyticus]|uniref:UPF0716 protein FxsA n=1 Tax=Thermaerobacillus caldiproteolyticus TaxID=247480 RepID=A0A7W0BX96_9BACL|nr:FxsA family protein [Anoxybacillus caldiproteolyticus]MBA2873788.1 UPF0716 protein FxsA [Anoxybacillus caldiproteolyticus]